MKNLENSSDSQNPLFFMSRIEFCWLKNGSKIRYSKWATEIKFL